MPRRPYKGWRCSQNIPSYGNTGWLDWEWKRPCIRKAGHEGKHRNSMIEWDDGAPVPDDYEEFLIKKKDN